MQHASDIRACLTAHQRGGNECFDLLTHCSLQSLLTKGGGGCEWEWGLGILCFLSAVKVLPVMENWAGRVKRMRKSSFEGFSKCDFYGCCCLVAKSCPTLCDPMDCTLPVSSVYGISQARKLEGLPFPSPEDLPNPGIKPESPDLAGGFFTTEPPGKP